MRTSMYSVTYFVLFVKHYKQSPSAKITGGGAWIAWVKHPVWIRTSPPCRPHALRPLPAHHQNCSNTTDAHSCKKAPER